MGRMADMYETTGLTLKERFRRWMRWHLVGYLHNHDEGDHPIGVCEGCEFYRKERGRR